MVTSEDRKKKLQLKVQLHYKTPKKEKMSKLKKRWTSCSMKSFNSIPTKLVLLHPTVPLEATLPT